MLFEIFDNLMILLFILFLVFIFRGYHLSKRQADEENEGHEG